MSEKKHLYNFMRSLVNRDYANAETNLKLVIEAKVKERINNSRMSTSKKSEDKDKQSSKSKSGKNDKTAPSAKKTSKEK